MESKNSAAEVALSYIRTLDSQEYDAVWSYLGEGIRVKGPSGESFSTAREFIEMLRLYRGKYNLKKVFADGDDVCLLYDLATPAATVFMCSWYQVKEGKIVSIQTVFDPRAFGSMAERKNDKKQGT